MHKWKDRCTKQQEKFFDQFDILENKLNGLFLSITEELSAHDRAPLADYKELHNHLTHVVNEREPLIISLVSTINDDILLLHKQLNGFKSKGNTEALKALCDITFWANKLESHKDLFLLMGEHDREVDSLLRAFNDVKISNARNLIECEIKTGKLRGELGSVLSSTVKQRLLHRLDEIDANFKFLLRPGQLPLAYKGSLVEVVRRREFSRILAEKLKFITDLLGEEAILRDEFLKTHGEALPKTFLKGIDMPVPDIPALFTSNLGGPTKALEDLNTLPEIEDGGLLEEARAMLKVCDGDLIQLNEAKKVNLDLKEEIRKIGERFDNKKTELLNKIEEMKRESSLQKNENYQLMNNFSMKQSQLETSLQWKNSEIKSLKSTLDSKEKRIRDQTEELEKLHKIVEKVTGETEAAINQKQKVIEQKEKEIHNLLVDLQNNVLRKKNCAFCNENIEFKGSSEDYIKEINGKLLEKTSNLMQIEVKLENTYKMMHSMSRSTFQLMSNKLNDKEQKMRETKELYEMKLMEFEDQLIGEQTKAQAIIRQKVTAFKEKIKEESRLTSIYYI